MVLKDLVPQLQHELIQAGCTYHVQHYLEVQLGELCKTVESICVVEYAGISWASQDVIDVLDFHELIHAELFEEEVLLDALDVDRQRGEEVFQEV